VSTRLRTEKLSPF
jgi:hypothetical protein